MSFSPGTTLGDYEVLGTLGAGGQGTVYRVRHVISRREEALKILLPDLEQAEELANRFIREIQVLARLNHPNIAALHTALKLQNQLLMVMELVEGESLRDRLRSPGVTLWEGVDYVMQTLTALDYAHRQGVVHRDMKPGNIMIAPGNIVKLLDFGIATGLEEPRLTRTGAVIGSIHYMSPEQIRGAPGDARSDLYSVGVTLWQIAAGRRPFESGGEYGVMMAHLEDDPMPPREIRGVPNALWEILRIALAKKPSGRFQTALEFREALRAIRTSDATSNPVVTNATSLATRVIPEPPNALVLEEISKQLAIFVGPIAKVLVKRTASKTQSLDDLYNRLAQEITSTRDREKFLASRSQTPGL